MLQVLFTIPNPVGPGGLPVPGFGLMLLLCFVLTAFVWGPRRALRVGLPAEKATDMAMWLFLAGIAGARVLYMVQYRHQFAGLSPLELAREFVSIWNGGIVFYGSMAGGVVGYILFRRTVLKRFGVRDWQLGDVIAPLIALGLAVGRIGCYLNGCCWGQPACEASQPVPLSADLGRFPVLTALSRRQVCEPAGPSDRLPEIRGLQTATGFTLTPRADGGDPRGVVAAVEPDSEAERAGLKPGDRIVGVNGKPNRAVVELAGPAAAVSAARDALTAAGGEPLSDSATAGFLVARVGFLDPTAYADRLPAVPGVSVNVHDDLWELARDWPRGRNRLDLDVDRAGERLSLSFVPRTVPYFPTQLYETVSMVLLIGVLLAFQPYRRHDGQVLVVFMVGYAVHRFLNEAIRIEPTYQLGLTLSQWISVGILLGAGVLELYLRATQAELPPGPQPLGAPARPA
jgi:prolipoprotein diacylglyceryltransferase